MATTFHEGQRVYVQMGRGPEGMDQQAQGTVTRIEDEQAVWVQLDDGGAERSWPSDRLEPIAAT
jgi:hypothetical protein